MVSLYYLIKLSLLFIQNSSLCVCLLHVSHEVLYLSLQPLLGLLQRRALGIHSLNGLFGLQTLSELLPEGTRIRFLLKTLSVIAVWEPSVETLSPHNTGFVYIDLLDSSWEVFSLKCIVSAFDTRADSM